MSARTWLAQRFGVADARGESGGIISVITHTINDADGLARALNGLTQEHVEALENHRIGVNTPNSNLMARDAIALLRVIVAPAPDDVSGDRPHG